MGATFWLSMVMGVVGIVGMLVAGRGKWQGWLIGLLVQPVWIAFFAVTQAWPGMILPVAYGTVYAKNLIAWRRQAKAVPEASEYDRLLARLQAAQAAYQNEAAAMGRGWEVVNQAVMDLGLALGVRQITEDEWAAAKFYRRFDVPGGTLQEPTWRDHEIEWMGLRALAREAARRLEGGAEMGLTKYGQGEVLPEPSDIKKQGSMTEEEIEDLEAENAEADK